MIRIAPMQTEIVRGLGQLTSRPFESRPAQNCDGVG
jgi:hypothetical protein